MECSGSGWWSSVVVGCSGVEWLSEAVVDVCGCDECGVSGILSGSSAVQ